MTYRAHFRCIAGCDGEYSLTEIIYRCPSCGNLLEVAHDLGALGERDAAGWKALFAERRSAVDLPDASGVWALREWVAPHVRAENIVSMFEGNTSLLVVDRYAREIGLERVRVKLCGNSHTGSFKDLGMTVLVSTVKQMIADGIEVPAIACASTGDTSAALAAYAAVAGVRAIVILPRGKISTAQLVQPLSNGASVLAIDSDFDGCMRLVTELSLKDGIYLANSMNSLRIEGQKSVAIEIAHQLGWTVPDWVVIPGGNLGNVSALVAGFRMLVRLGLTDRMPRVCVAQSARANPLYQSYVRDFAGLEPVVAQATLASAIRIGNPVSYEKAVSALKEVDGVVEQSSEAELADAAARADLSGLFACPHTGVALAALEKLAAKGQIRPSESVVVVSTANGLKFSDFKTGYHDSALSDVRAPTFANRPIELPNDYGAVKRAVLGILEKTG